MTGAPPSAFPASPPAPGVAARNGAPRPRPFFLLALLLGLGLNALFFGLFRVTAPPVAPVKFPSAYVRYLGGSSVITDAVLNDQALLFDSEPLFLPTSWNFSSPALPFKTPAPSALRRFPRAG